MPSENPFRQFLRHGARHGARYGLGFRHGRFDGGTGIKLGNRSGNSLEFMEHRDYVPGDDLRLLDWNVYARTERLTVKMFREEINPRLDLIVDGSASMALPGTGKAEAVLKLTGVLAAAAANSGYLTHAWINGDRLEPIVNGSGPVERWGEIGFAATVSPAAALQSFAGGFQYHGIRIVVTDLLWDDSPAHFLTKLGSGAAAVIVLQVLASMDIEPPAAGKVRLADVETELTEELFLDAIAIERYRTAIARHQQNWERACREHGAVLITLTAETLLADWNLQPLLVREIIRTL